MATLLLIVIYICFIGLGVPDSLFGPAWPVMSGEFGLPVSVAGLMTDRKSTRLNSSHT